MRALPVDFRRCRPAACADVAGDGARCGGPQAGGRRPPSSTWSTAAGRGLRRRRLLGMRERAACTCSTGSSTPTAPRCAGFPWPGAGAITATTGRATRCASAPGGGAHVRASSHHGYNYAQGARNWGSESGIGILRGAAEAAGLRTRDAWGPETGMLFVSGGSHAGNVEGDRPRLHAADPGQAAEAGAARVPRRRRALEVRRLPALAQARMARPGEQRYRLTLNDLRRLRRLTCTCRSTSFRGYLGGIRRAPSSRIVSPLIIWLRTISSASDANSSGCPRRLGKGISAPRASRRSCGSAASIGVSKVPGRDRHHADAA